MQHNCSGAEHLHDLGHDGLEEAVEGGVIRAVPHRHVDRVELSMPLPDVLQIARAREEVVAVLVEADRQDPAHKITT